MDDEAHEQEADRLEKEADRLETAGDAVGDQIDSLREDWDQKKKGSQAAGAMDKADAAPGGLGAEEEDDSEDDDSEDEDFDKDYISR